MHLKHLRLFATALLAFMACTLTASPRLPALDVSFLGDPGTPTPANLIIPGETGTTPTPFLPIDPTARAATPTSVPAAPWGSYAGPSVPPSIPVPPPAKKIEQPEGQINILLLGSDQRPNTTGYRTDTMLLVTLSPFLGTVSITSFPRDLFVYIPGWTMQRLNTAQPHGGFVAMQDTFEYNFGVRPDFYALVNFQGFVQLVDSLGGVNVNVAVRLTDQRDGFGEYTVPAGTVTMDGETALWYVRSRYSSSDFERNRRQQEVILAIFYKLLSLNGIQRAPELYTLFRNNVVTDAAFNDLAPLLGLASDIAADSSKMALYSINPSHVTAFTTSAGAAVLLPDYEAIAVTMRQVLNAP